MPFNESAQDVMDSVRSVYLNDPSGATYTNAVILPHLKTAYEELASEFEVNDLGLKRSIAYIKVSANSPVLAVPGDFMYPIELKERNWGSTSETDFSDMSQREIEPTREKTNRLINWVFRDGTVHFVGATTDREVKLVYQNTFPRLSDGTVLVRGESLAYLSARAAAYVHIFVSQNETLAKAAQGISDKNLAGLIRTNVKRIQSLGVRRRPYRPSTR